MRTENVMENVMDRHENRKRGNVMEKREAGASSNNLPIRDRVHPAANLKTSKIVSEQTNIVLAHLWSMIMKNLRIYPALRAPMPRIQPSLEL